MTRPRTVRTILPLLLCGALLGAACSSDPVADPLAEELPTTSTVAQDAATEGAEAGAGTDSTWQMVRTPADCKCSDGSPFHFWVRRGDPERVLFFLQGGGACFSAETCGPARPTFTRNLVGEDGGDAEAPEASGIFDLDEPENPFADHSIVYVPYCTGDLHLGNATHDYGDGVVVHHNGLSNASTALTATAALFPDATEVVVAGASAGSAGAPMYGGLAHDVLPDARITVVADGSAAYPDDEGITAAIGGLWGSHAELPPWPETEGDPVAAWTLPGLFVQTSRHVPDATFATINSAYDETQARFTELIGFPGDLLDMIDANNELIEAAVPELHSWVNAGTMHTVLGRPQLYTLDEGGTSLRDWLEQVITGDSPEDVRCTDCA